MKNYFRIMLGRKSVFADEAHWGNFIGAGWLEDVDLTGQFPESWREFNKKFIPVLLAGHPEKSKISAGLACGALHTIGKGIQMGDIVLCPDGTGLYLVGEVVTDYQYQQGGNLPHRRGVKWFSNRIQRTDMSLSLRNSTGSIGTVSDVSRYAEEIDRLISGDRPPVIVSTDETVEDVSEFAMEEHLEDFLIENWESTLLGKDYDIFVEDGKLGQQYPTDTGEIDILAISKDKKTILVLELKKGRASDVVVGQIQRYMGYVKDELAEPEQRVKGIIIAFEDSQRIHRALSVAQNIELYTYQIRFSLQRVVRP